MKKKLKSNRQILTTVLDNPEAGVLAQAWVLEAMIYYIKAVEKAGPKGIASSPGLGVSGDQWLHVTRLSKEILEREYEIKIWRDE